jgi:putative transposase
MTYNPKIHHRRSIRLKSYNYANEGLYFITICCKNKEKFFGEIHNGEMILNPIGKIAFDEWKQTQSIRTNCLIHEFIIMPDHIHGIIEITENQGEKDMIGKFQSPKQTIGSFIRGYKIATIKRIKDLLNFSNSINPSTVELQFDPTTALQFDPTRQFERIAEKIKKLNFKIWQSNYYERIIRDQRAYMNISLYIKNNPKKWQEKQLKNK